MAKAKSINAYDKFLVIEKLKTQTKIPVTIYVPTVVNNHIHLFIESCKLNGTNITNLFTLIFMNGYSLYKKFLDKGIDSIMEMNYVISYFLKVFDNVVSSSQNEWSMNQPAIIFMASMCEKYKLDFYEVLEYVGKNRYIVGDRLVLEVKDIVTIFKKYKEEHKIG